MPHHHVVVGRAIKKAKRRSRPDLGPVGRQGVFRMTGTRSSRLQYAACQPIRFFQEARAYSRLSLEMKEALISAGQTASHS